MKQLLISLLVVAVLIQGCKKKDSEPDSLIGTWAWGATYIDAPLGPNNPQTPANTATKQKLNFNIKYWTFVKDSLNTVSGGNYNIGFFKNIDGRKINSIHYFNSINLTDSTTYYSINKDTLTFSNVYGGTVGSGYTIYIRN